MLTYKHDLRKTISSKRQLRKLKNFLKQGLLLELNYSFFLLSLFILRVERPHLKVYLSMKISDMIPHIEV